MRQHFPKWPMQQNPSPVRYPTTFINNSANTLVLLLRSPEPTFPSSRILCNIDSWREVKKKKARRRRKWKLAAFSFSFLRMFFLPVVFIPLTGTHDNMYSQEWGFFQPGLFVYCTQFIFSKLKKFHNSSHVKSAWYALRYSLYTGISILQKE